MMNKNFIKKQMETIGLSTNKLKDITGIGYATLSDYLNKDNYNISAKHYVTIVNTLFTPFEQLLYANAEFKAVNGKNDADYWFNELKHRKVIEAIELDKLVVDRSGAPTSDETGVIRTLPVYTKLTFKDAEGNSTIRIFDDSLYRDLDKKGKRDKLEIIKQYFE